MSLNNLKIFVCVSVSIKPWTVTKKSKAYVGVTAKGNIHKGSVSRYGNLVPQFQMFHIAFASAALVTSIGRTWYFVQICITVGAFIPL
jgi:hypothetical protein